LDKWACLRTVGVEHVLESHQHLTPQASTLALSASPNVLSHPIRPVSGVASVGHVVFEQRHVVVAGTANDPNRLRMIAAPAEELFVE
jgi:hypothetical protein